MKKRDSLPRSEDTVRTYIRITVCTASVIINFTVLHCPSILNVSLRGKASLA